MPWIKYIQRELYCRDKFIHLYQCYIAYSCVSSVPSNRFTQKRKVLYKVWHSFCKNNVCHKPYKAYFYWFYILILASTMHLGISLKITFFCSSSTSIWQPLKETLFSEYKNIPQGKVKMVTVSKLVFLDHNILPKVVHEVKCLHAEYNNQASCMDTVINIPKPKCRMNA